MRNCIRCGLTGLYKNLDSGSTGECKYCRQFKPKSFMGAEQFREDLSLTTGEKIGITVSGGKDSIYMWGVLTEILGKDKICAFMYYRPGITHHLAYENVVNASKILGTEVVIIEDAKAYPRFKRNLEVILSKPLASMIRVALCVGCRYGITENIYNRGQKMGITKFVSGASYLELAPFKEELLEEHSDCDDIECGLKNALRDYPELDYDDNISLILRDQKFKYKNNDTGHNNFTSGYKYQLFDFDNYFENNPEKIEKIVTEKYGWKCPERSWHFDCIIEEFKDIFYYGLLGYTETDFKLAAMVRYGLLSLSEAERELEVNNRNLAKSYKKMCGILKQYEISYLEPKLKAFYEVSKYLESEA